MNLLAPARYPIGDMNADLIAYELRRCGTSAVLAPLAFGAIVLAVMASGAAQPGTLGAWAAMASFPLVAGLAVVASLERERLVELLLTLATPYRTTVARRMLVLGAGMAGGAVLCALPGAGRELPTLVAATLLLAGVGVWAACAAPSTGAAACAVIGAWLAELLLVERFVAGSLFGAALLLALAAGPALSARRVLADSERLLALRGPR